MSGGKGNLAGIEARGAGENRHPQAARWATTGSSAITLRCQQGPIRVRCRRTYIRKQTLANCERYITQELKDLEDYDSAAPRTASAALEYEYFYQSCEPSICREQAARVQAVLPRRWRRLDVLCSLAAGGRRSTGYVTAPTVDLAGEIHITRGPPSRGGADAEG